MMEYPPEWKEEIPRSDAIAFIVEHAYGELISRRALSWRNATRRVRERIRYAVGKKELTDAEPLNAPQLFSWAVTKWPTLTKVEGLPQVTAIMAITTPAPAIDSTMGDDIPEDRIGLMHALSNAECRASRYSKENADLRKRLEVAEEKIKKREEVEVARKKVSSESGKKGKGIPHRKKGGAGSSQS